MFRCLDCGCLFEYPVHYKEQRGDFYYEEWDGCPRCAGDFREEDDYESFD